ncbi:MAG: hypothetical protein K0S55_1111, partial [Clostridia bacterium]|nr:hypothetical protein [Clostridia bacterium]
MNIFKSFKEPDRKTYSAKPFWAWNGKLKKEELIRQIYIMKDMGFGGFFMHSRTGLETEYLGEEWFELINACADEAEKLDMEAYIYDEDRWPSGSAGGIATINKKYRMKYIRVNLINKRDFIWNDEVISAFSINIDKNVFTECERIYGNVNIDDLSNRHIVYFTVETMDTSEGYNGNAYLDTLNKEAMDVFIKTTHERYKAHCGDRLGKSIPGIFTDEPHRGALMCGFSVTNRQPLNLCPYTYTLFNDFFKKYGYRLEDRLPELFYRKNGEVFSQVKWHYTELVTQLFLDNFAAPYQAWCKENNLKVTGHILHEDNLTCQTAAMGSVMRYYEYMDYPGVDVLTQYNDSYCIVKQLSSAARQLGKKFLLSELDGCTGWQMSFEDFKGIGDWQAIMGINLRCPHLSWYTMRGEAKRDYPGSILHQATWYAEYRTLEDYYARIAVITVNAERVCDTLVINPVESVWAQIYPGWANGMGIVSPEVAEVEDTFRNTYMTLLSGHVDFDYADEDMLSRMAEIVCNENDILLMVGKAKYKRVIISGMKTIRSTTLKILREFSEKGGSVIFSGDPPRFLDALPSIFPLELSHNCSELNLDEVCSNYNDLYISSPDIFLQTYTDDEYTYCLLLNIKRKEAVENVIIKPKNTFSQEWEPSNGERYNVIKDNDGNIVWSFLPGQLKILTFAKNTLTLPDKQVVKEDRRVYAEEEFTMTTDEPNILVLDYPSYKIGKGEWQQPTEILKADQ